MMTDKEQNDLLIRIDERTNQILAQTKLTNGKVIELRTDVDSLKLWRSKLAGIWIAIGVLSTVAGVVLGLAIEIWYKNQEQKNGNTPVRTEIQSLR
jgi:hypothetical protein